MRHGTGVALLAASALALAPGSAAYAAKTAQYSGRFAAKYPAVAEAKSVGVLGFNGRDGEAFAAVLTAALQSAAIDGQQILSVKTIEGMNYKSTGDDLSRAEIAKAMQLGKKLGVKAVFTGTITAASVTSNNFTKTETVCLKSKKIFKCEQAATQQVPCTKVAGQYSVAPRVILVSTGQLIYSEAVSVQEGFTICNGELQAETMQEALAPLATLFSPSKAAAAPKRATTPEDLLQRLRANVAEQVRQHVVPYNKTVTVTFRDNASDLPKPTQAKLKNALEFAQAGRLDRACSILEGLLDDSTRSNVTILYNLGVCQEAMLPEAPTAALEYYAKADQLLEKPDKLVSEAYLRTKTMVGSQRSITRSMAGGTPPAPAAKPAAKGKR